MSESINTKSYIKKAFPNISPTAIKCVDDEWQIVGKYGSITPFENGKWDMYMTGSTNRINKWLSYHQTHCVEAPFHVGDGEAWATLQPTELNQINTRLLGIRKKRILSQEQLDNLSMNLKRARENKNGK